MGRNTNAALEALLEQSEAYAFDGENIGGRAKMRGGNRGGNMRGGNMRGALKQNGASYKPQAAQFDIVIERLTANLDYALPVFVFGSQHFIGGYKGVLDVPSGLTLQVKAGIVGHTTSAFEYVDFEYSDGTDTDIVRVKTNSGAPYPSFLMANLTDLFFINGMRYSISDTTQLGQLSQSFIEVEKSLFGKASENPISITSFKDPKQFQSGIIDVPYQGGIDKEKGFLVDIIAEANFAVTLSVAVQKFEQLANY